MTPMKPKHPCNWPGCRSLASTRYCDTHTKQAEAYNNKQRATATERGYNYTWSRLRILKLNMNPLCERCGKAAILVHHKDRDTNNSSIDNLESLCVACHDIEHKHERWRGRAASILPDVAK